MIRQASDAGSTPVVTVMVLEEDDGLLPVLIGHLRSRGHECLVRTNDAAVFGTTRKDRTPIPGVPGADAPPAVEPEEMTALALVEATCRNGTPAVVILAGHRDQFAELDSRLVRIVPLPIRFGPRQIAYEFEAILARQDAA